jgi:hypothetical protein
MMAAILLISVAGVQSYPKIIKRNKATKLTSEEILDKAILYYDYFHVWSNYYGKMIIRSIQDEGTYVVCTGILNVNGLKVPLCQTYFKGTDNSIWMVDVFAAAQ